MKKLINFITEEFFFCAFLVLLIILSCYKPTEIGQYYLRVDWKTIFALTGLLVITTGLKESNYFDILAKQILAKMKTERTIAFFLILLSAGLSCFVTNDIALFIVVPLTLSLRTLTGGDISKLVIFEAIAVNAGSALTPIGNPQNLYLWHQWRISFFSFIGFVLPLVIILMIILFIFTLFVFPRKEINYFDNASKNITLRKPLLYISLTALLVYIAALELGLANFLLPIVLIIYAIFYRRVLLKVDWLLLVMFVIIFIDFHLIARLSVVQQTISQIDIKFRNNIFLLSAGISQIISNVPASVFISKFTDDWLAITYGVNVGGNGIVIASLANIIALRMLKDKKAWLTFHKYSIPYFMITTGLIYYLFQFF